MKNKIVKGVLFVSAITVMFACNTKKEEPLEAAVVDKEQIKVDTEQIKKDIQARENAFAELYNKGEIKDIGYYANDATSFYPNRAPLIGKPAIVEFLKSDMVKNSNKISFTTNDIFPSSDGNQIVEIGYFKLTDSANMVINTGYYMSLFEKRDGKYVCLRDMSASDMPIPSK